MPQKLIHITALFWTQTKLSW